MVMDMNLYNDKLGSVLTESLSVVNWRSRKSQGYFPARTPAGATCSLQACSHIPQVVAPSCQPVVVHGQGRVSATYLLLRPPKSSLSLPSGRARPARLPIGRAGQSRGRASRQNKVRPVGRTQSVRQTTHAAARGARFPHRLQQTDKTQLAAAMSHNNPSNPPKPPQLCIGDREWRTGYGWSSAAACDGTERCDVDWHTSGLATAEPCGLRLSVPPWGPPISLSHRRPTLLHIADGGSHHPGVGAAGWISSKHGAGDRSARPVCKVVPCRPSTCLARQHRNLGSPLKQPQRRPLKVRRELASGANGHVD